MAYCPAVALCSEHIHTPLGRMFAVADDRGLILCEFRDRPMLATQLKRVEAICGERPIEASHPILDQTRRELGEYFLGQRETFSIPLVLDGRAWQMSVWNELLQIPFGKTSSYDDIAVRLLKPGGARAVGRANGDNRIAIIVPCHRVISADGGLSGYRGGRERKRWLLAHERRGVQLTFGAEWD